MTSMKTARSGFLHRAGLVATLAGITATLVTGCAEGGATTEGGNAKTVAFAHPASDSPIYPLLVHGAQKVADERGYELLSSSADYDSAAQVDELNTWIAQKIAGVIILPIDNAAMNPIIDKAKENKVKFLAYSNLVLPGADGSVVFDNLQGAELIGTAVGEWINETLGGDAQIALLTDNDQQAGKDRINGAMEAIRAVAPDVEVVAEQEGLFADETLPIFQSMLQANPDINVVLCMTDDGCIGAEKAFMQTNPSQERQDQMFMAGWDGSVPALQRIVDGSVIRATALLDIVGIGEASIEATINAVEGKQPTDIKFPYVLVDESDPELAQEYIDKFEAITNP